MSREGMSDQVRAHGFGDTRSLRCLAAGRPQYFRCDWLIGAPAVFCAWKQIGLGPHPAPIFAQGLQQLRAKRHVAVAVPLAMANMDEHALTVNVLDLEVA